MFAVSNGNGSSRVLEVTLVVLCLVSSAFALSSLLQKDYIQVVKEGPISLRLPNDTIPIHYDIHLSTNVHTDDRAYEGQVKITIKCEQSTRNVVLHNHELKILTVQLKSNSSSVDVTAFETTERTEFLNITLGRALEVGEEYTLFITFTGELSSSKLGWYRGSYNDKGEIYFATTHFEPIYARRAFPCYDEPAKKATILLKITHSNTYHALSNMPISSNISSGNDTTTTTFQVTPSMSVYTLAFLVSDFERNCRSDAKGREHCIYAIPEKMASTDLPLENSVKAIALYEDLLGVEYSLPKLDHVSIPYSHFPAGAMENWGLVMYNEFNLLIEPSEDGRAPTSIMMHEIAHQWFGNLVSPKWWSNFWLNEGFATLFEYYATDKLYPEMHKIKSLMHIVASVKETDFYNHRPMTNYTEETSLEAIDNYIDYRKSAGVLLMFMVVLGEDTFLKGLSYYIRDMQYKNAVPDDLSRGLQRAVDESNVLPKDLPVKTILDSWHLQGGVPIVTASRSSPTTVTLIQHRHQKLYPNTSLSNWYIPLTFTESANVSFESSMAQDWFRGDTDQHEITISADSSWYLLNPNRTFYYQVNYDVNNWQQIAKALNDPEQRKQIPVVNRANLIDDTLQLANEGFLEMTVAFEIFHYLRQETDDLPWKPVQNRLFRVKKLLMEFLLILIKDRN